MLNSHILQGDGLDFMAKCGPLFDLIYAKIAEQRLDLVLNPPYKEPY